MILNMDKEIEELNKKTFSILGISIWRILAYFIIYSFLGYIIETIFGIVTKGVWESRQSFLYGPFCGIYGLGACIMIIFLHKYYKQHNTLFVLGFIIGSIVEYMVSWIGDILLHVKWWDYSTYPLNLNGRICVYFSFFWGFLAIYLICSANPKVDKFINWIKTKFSINILKIITFLTTIFLAVDCIITIFAVHLFLIRMKAINNLDVPNKEIVLEVYNKIYNNEKLSDIVYKFWGNKKMIRTFPNLKINDVNGNIIFVDTLLNDIQPYYLRIHHGNENIRDYGN